MLKTIICPACGKGHEVYANPSPTTDVVIHAPGKGVVVIARANEPVGHAIPGGFIDEGEWTEDAALREMREETGMDVALEGLLGVYSRPDRDPRHHTMTAVYVAVAPHPETLAAGDDAAGAFWINPERLPDDMCFDHARILADYLEVVHGTRSLAGLSTEWLATEAGRRNERLLSQCGKASLIGTSKER